VSSRAATKISKASTYGYRYILDSPSSAEPERTFSGARRTQSWGRLRLSAENLERLECVGNWLRNGHIDITSLITVLQELDEIEVVSDIEPGSAE
jgi:hypothetical protein